MSGALVAAAILIAGICIGVWLDVKFGPDRTRSLYLDDPYL